jgi:polar amino acid transport system substrate-binding protein
MLFHNLGTIRSGASSMRRLQIRLSAFCLVLTIASTTFASETVRITNGEWPPFTSERIQHAGVLSRLVSEAFALEGVTVEYSYFPWKRAYESAKTGEFDGSVGWAPTPAHLQDFYMSDPVIDVDKAFFHLKTTPFTWTTLEDLHPWRIGSTAGYSYGPDWDQAVKEGQLQIEEVTMDEQNIRKLVAKRVDVVAMEIEVADYMIQTFLTPEEAASITRHPKLLMQTPICLALSRESNRSETLLARFNRGLRLLKSSGRYSLYLEESRRGGSLRR